MVEEWQRGWKKAKEMVSLAMQVGTNFGYMESGHLDDGIIAVHICIDEV